MAKSGATLRHDEEGTPPNQMDVDEQTARATELETIAPTLATAVEQTERITNLKNFFNDFIRLYTAYNSS